MKDFKSNYLLILLIASLFIGSIGVLSYNKYLESRLRGQKAQGSSQYLKDMAELKSVAIQSLAARRYHATTNDPVFEKKAIDNESLALSLLAKLAASPEQDYRDKAILIKKRFDKARNTVNSNSLTEQSKLLEEIDGFIRHEEVVFSGRLNKLVGLNRNFFIAIVFGSFFAFMILVAMNYYLFMARKKSEVLQKNLDDFRERQAQSFQATNDGIFEWKLKEQAVYWSPRLKEMIGYQDGDLTGSLERFEQLMHPEDREVYWNNVHQHLRGEVAEHSAFFRWRHKDGHWVWINSRGRAVFNEFGEPEKLIGVYTDVTKLKEYELQLAKSKNEAEKANKAKSEFLAHMSHEIRTPLTAVTGVAEILNMQRDRFDEKTRKLMDALNTSAITLKDLINDILDFSKIESGKIVLENKEIELGDFFDQLITVFSVKAAEKKLELVFETKTLSGISIYGDKIRLRQILINLIGNAIKFTNKGFVRVSAEITSSDGKEYLHVRISDSGIGIDAESLPFIFDSFKQADATISRKFGGTGLGLPIAMNLAKLMGGRIYAESQLGQGSVFIFEMPVSMTAAIGELSKLDTLNTRVNLKDDDKILIVEDYEGNIAFLTHMMDEAGIKYDLARTGLEALKLWGANLYRIILMDIQMPEMDGISAVKHIRQIEQEKEQPSRIPVIAMTAHAFQEDRGKCMAAGFDEYLPKPLSKEALFTAISKLLGSK